LNSSVQAIELKTKVKLLGILACIVLLISIFFPFLKVYWKGMTIPEIRSGPLTLWSFKGTMEIWYLGRGRVTYEYWFSDYWFLDIIYRYEELGHWIGPALILTLATQILAPLFSAIAILLDKSKLFLFPIVLSAITLSCMLLVTYALQHNYEGLPVAGFWLTLTAAALFSAALFISRRPRNERNPISPT